jgi:YgiT-type zinc finger domain-containing protein
MDCLHCKGRLQRGLAPFSIDRRGYHVHWDGIPAWVCTQCGEPLFDTHVVEEIQRTFDALDGATDCLATTG